MNYSGIYVGPRPPKWLVDTLSRVGTNIFGKPLYRLVHAGFRLEPSGGTWIEWDESLLHSERREDRNHPIKRVVEVRMALKYPEVRSTQDGAHWWILEKWNAPESYGPPERWYLPQTSGGTLLWIEDALKYVASQGDYPYDGAYEHAGYEFPQCALTERVVMTAVSRSLLAMRDTKRPNTAYGRMLRRVYEAQEAEKAISVKRRQVDMDILDEANTAFGNNPTLFPGKKRRRSVNDFAEKAGIKSHAVS